MADFYKAILTVLRNEGGLVDNPHDPGGITKYGISKRSYPNLDIAKLTIDEAEAIYQKDFWKFSGILDQNVATKLFDTYVNMQHNAIKIAQSLVHVAIDGNYGPQTENVINTQNPGEFLRQYRSAIAQHYKDIVESHPDKSVFLKGWLARAAQ